HTRYRRQPQVMQCDQQTGQLDGVVGGAADGDRTVDDPLGLCAVRGLASDQNHGALPVKEHSHDVNQQRGDQCHSQRNVQVQPDDQARTQRDVAVDLVEQCLALGNGLQQLLQ